MLRHLSIVIVTIVFSIIESQAYAQTNDDFGPLAPAKPVPVSASQNVQVIVESNLYNSGLIDVGLNQYLQDITRQGYNPVLTTSAFSTSTALRSYLADYRSSSGLAGAVLIGNLPSFTFQATETIASDLFYQDLDGLWADTTGDGKYNSHTGNVAPEIWLGRLKTNNLVSLHAGRTEASLLNEYFAKNHAYRTKQLNLSNNGLAYIDDDWSGYWGNLWSSQLDAAVAGTVTKVDASDVTTAANYKSHLQAGYEHVLVTVHSNHTMHSFKIGDTWSGGTMYNSQLKALDPQVFFYDLFACSNANYTQSGYMAGEYVFGTNMGLLAVGSTNTGGMLEFSDYFNPLGQGKTFGEAWLAWFAARAAGGFSAYETDWHYGMTMIGDPLLVTQAFRPDFQTMWQGTVGVVGDWSTTANWSNGLPSQAVDSIIDNGGKARISSGTIAVADVYIGLSAQGSMEIAGGSLAAGVVYVGRHAGSSGDLTFIGGSLSANILDVGSAGAGQLNLSTSSASLNVLHKVGFGPGAILTATPGATLRLAGVAFENASSTPLNMAGLNNLTLLIEGGSAVTATVEAAGQNIGLTQGGFNGNFALGSLLIGSEAASGNVKLVNSYTNVSPTQPEALHVTNLVLGAGSTLNLNGQTLYYQNATNLGGTVTLNGGQLIHDDPAHIRVYLEADRVFKGEYQVKVYVQIIGSMPGEGLSDLYVSVYTPDSSSITLPKAVNGTVYTSWNVALADMMKAWPAAQDYVNELDPDSDIDAIGMTVLDPYMSVPDFALEPILIGTQTWRMLDSQPITLAASISSSSRHWDTFSGLKVPFQILEGSSLTVGTYRGDFTGDGIISSADIDSLYRNFGGNLYYDLTGNGVVDRGDIDELVRTILDTTYGDTDLSSTVDFTDFQCLLDSWTKPGLWANGDFDGNGSVDFVDFQLMLNNWRPSGQAPVPEPATLTLLLASGTIILRGRRRL